MSATLRSTPPVGSITRNSCLVATGVRLRNAIVRPSGDQLGHNSYSGRLVRRNGEPVTICCTYRSCCATDSGPVQVKTTKRPSGESDGELTHPGIDVRGTARYGSSP